MKPEDVELLANLDSKLAVVRDRTRSVALRYTTGFFLYGEGGMGKSYAVLTELDRLNADYKLHNSRMTGRGLFDALCDFPDSIHVLEDMEALFDDRMAQGVLRSALWGQAKDDRPVRHRHLEKPQDRPALPLRGRRHRHLEPPARRPAGVERHRHPHQPHPTARQQRRGGCADAEHRLKRL